MCRRPMNSARPLFLYRLLLLLLLLFLVLLLVLLLLLSPLPWRVGAALVQNNAVRGTERDTLRQQRPHAAWLRQDGSRTPHCSTTTAATTTTAASNSSRGVV